MKSLTLLLFAAVALTSCERRVVVDQYGNQVPQQVIVQQPVYQDGYNQPTVIHHDNGASNFVAGAIIGSALSNGGNRRTTVINRTTVVRPRGNSISNYQSNTRTRTVNTPSRSVFSGSSSRPSSSMRTSTRSTSSSSTSRTTSRRR